MIVTLFCRKRVAATTEMSTFFLVLRHDSYTDQSPLNHVESGTTSQIPRAINMNTLSLHITFVDNDLSRRTLKKLWVSMKIIFSRDIMKNPLRITFQVLFAMETLYLVTKHIRLNRTAFWTQSKLDGIVILGGTNYKHSWCFTVLSTPNKSERIFADEMSELVLCWLYSHRGTWNCYISLV